MQMNFPFPEIWSLVDQFKEQCRLNAWETLDTEDWVKTEDGEYHSLLCTASIHPSTFVKIVINRKCGIRRNGYYEVVDLSYIGWIFQEKPAESLIITIAENPELIDKIAIFDLSQVYSGRGSCRILNETESIVFKEFERFLEDEWNVEFKPIKKIHAIAT